MLPQPVHAANIGRVISLKAGLPYACPAMTVHRNCASGIESVTTAASRLLLGEHRVVIAGGVESMSQIPLIYRPEMANWFSAVSTARSVRQRLLAMAQFRMRYLRPIVGIVAGLTDPTCGLVMGQTAENLSREFGIDRGEQDRFALLSHQKASRAQSDGRFEKEIVPFPVPPHYAQFLSHDDGIRHDQTEHALKKLRPYFDKACGTVTVGNTCSITDGAAALMLMKASTARDWGICPLGYFRHWAYAGLAPERMGLGPAFAIAKVLQQSNMHLQDIDLIEINEAFSAQVLANFKACSSPRFCQHELGLSRAIGDLDLDRVNIHGGAIALGHPVGATGTRLILGMLTALHATKQQTGLVSLCVGGGQGAAMIVERAS